MQVANFELSEEEAAALESEQADAKAAEEAAAAGAARARGAPSAKFWDSLLKDQHTAMEAQELAQLGRGRRSRRAINYAEDGAPDRAGDAGAGTSKAAGRKRGRDDEYQPEEEEEDDDDEAHMQAAFDPMLQAAAADAPAGAAGATQAKGRTPVHRRAVPANGVAGQPLYSGVPGDSSFAVLGLNSMQRKEYLRAVMRLGLPLSDDGFMDFGTMLWYRHRRLLCCRGSGGEPCEQLREVEWAVASADAGEPPHCVSHREAGQWQVHRDHAGPRSNRGADPHQG